MADMVQIVVQVPADRVADLYDYAAALNRPALGVGEEELQPWRKGDEEIARKMYAACAKWAQSVLDYLCDRPGQPILGEEIAQALGMPAGNKSVAGSLSSAGIQCTKVHRHMPYKFEYAEGATAGLYTMPDEIAQMFHQARGGS